MISDLCETGRHVLCKVKAWLFPDTENTICDCACHNRED